MAGLGQDHFSNEKMGWLCVAWMKYSRPSHANYCRNGESVGDYGRTTLTKYLGLDLIYVNGFILLMHL